MALKYLDNLVKVGNLKEEAPDQIQFNEMVGTPTTLLEDLKVEGLSEEGKFSLAYGAAHSLARAALRWHGYRSDDRYIVFQCLAHTVGFEDAKWRVLDKCHNLRNQAEYEGVLDITPQLLEELTNITEELHTLVNALGPIK